MVMGMAGPESGTAKRRASAREAAPPPAAAKPRILVVDDDEGLLVLMAELLRGEGYDVLTADSGASALERMRDTSPDLLLLDFKLRDLAGSELVQRLREQHRLAPFIMVTGQGDERVAVEVMKQGALDYVMKDAALFDLLPTVVRRALRAVERDRALAAADCERERLEREILEASEREQHRIGEDLHDGLGQQLTAIEMLCASLKSDVAARQPELAAQVAQIGALLREAIAQTRSMARGLVPVKDEPDALWASLIELADRTTALGRMPCRFECARPVLVPSNAVAGHLYRIAQEAVNNAIKHSGATDLVIRLAASRSMLELKISDNGCGLPETRTAGLGLRVMRHRAEVIGAELTIDSRPGRGVTISCVLPRHD
jgi:signal transduction histidine kinase